MHVRVVSVLYLEMGLGYVVSAVALRGLRFTSRGLCLVAGRKIAMAEEKPAVIFILGGPGAGKGTQCENIVKEFDFVHLSAGELLRKARNSGSSDGQLIADYIKEGKIVPVEITIKLLMDAMTESPKNKFLIDGFPRNEDNLVGWEKQMTDKVDVKFVLFFECPEEICLERVIKRGQSSGRTDDNSEAFVKRYRQYLESTMPIVNIFKDRNMVRLVSSVPPPDQVFDEVKKLFRDI